MSDVVESGGYTPASNTEHPRVSDARFGVADLTVCSDDPRARARFINLQAEKTVKEFKKKLRNYKRPDFNRMILDLNRLGYTHEKIAFLLPVKGASTVSEWARGGIPNYDYGTAFVMLWQALTCIQRFPLDGEWATYRYKIGQLDMFEDWDELDVVIEQLDREIEK